MRKSLIILLAMSLLRRQPLFSKPQPELVALALRQTWMVGYPSIAVAPQPIAFAARGSKANRESSLIIAVHEHVGDDQIELDKEGKPTNSLQSTCIRLSAIKLCKMTEHPLLTPEVLPLPRPEEFRWITARRDRAFSEVLQNNGSLPCAGPEEDTMHSLAKPRCTQRLVGAGLKRPACAAIIGTLLLFGPARAAEAQELRLAAWNFGEGTVENVEQRAGPTRAAGAELRPDVIVLEEVTSFAAVQRIAIHLGMGPVDIAVSNFSRDTGESFAALEVAVISKQPIRSLTEFDTKNDGFGPITIINDGTVTMRSRDASGHVPDQVVAVRPDLPGFNEDDKPGPRGFLRVALENGLIVYAVHLKSSRIGLCFNGKDLMSNLRRSAKDLENVPSGRSLAGDISTALQSFSARTYADEIETSPAVTEDALHSARQREATIAAVAVEVGKDVAAGETVVVAGDFNTPLNEPCKTGEKLTEDNRPTIKCSDTITAPTCQADGYDDTLALLTKGLVGDLRMRALTTSATGRTFANPVFVDSPIDHIFVAGPRADRFDPVERVGTAQPDENGDLAVFGSDHYPIETKFRP